MERPNLPEGLPEDIETKKATAQAWFEALRDRICKVFEEIEDGFGEETGMEPGRFKQTEWSRENEGGGADTVARATVELACIDLASRRPQVFPYELQEFLRAHGG